MADTNIGFRADETLNTALSAAASRAGTSVSEIVRDGLRRVYAVDRPSYGVGSQYSFVGDARALLSRGVAGDADTRLAQLRSELAAGRGPEFAVTTGNASQVVPPGFEPLVPEMATDRPLAGLCRVLPLAGPGPFGVPGTAAVTGVGAHVEGTNPTGGALALGGGNVAPTGISGVIDLSRELADAATSAADAIVFGAMEEAYAQQSEARIAAELAAVTAGTITNGLAPSGAQVATTAAATVVDDTLKLLARMVKLRRRRARAAVATADAAIAEALAAGAITSGSVGRLDQATGDDTALWRPMGTPLNLSPDLASTSGATAVIAASADSVFAWESPGRQFTYEEPAGPAVLRLSLFRYFATRTLRPVGVAALRVS